MKQHIEIKFQIVLALCFGCIAHSFSQIVNSGNLQIETSAKIYFVGDYTNNGVHNNKGNLYLDSNFINNGSTSAVSGTTFFRSPTNETQQISGTTNNINLYNLEVNVTAAGKKGVSVVNNFGLYIENSVSLVSGDLRLTSDSQLIQTHAGSNANSSVLGKLLRDQQGVYSSYGYNYWSSPVNNGGTFSLSGGLFDGTDASVNAFTPQQVLFNAGSPYNGAPSAVDGGGNVTTALTINTNWLYKYSQGSGNYADWIKIDENSFLNPGEGFTMKGTNTSDASQNYVFKGIPNDGTYLFAINAGESSLLGNPYPSAIDIHKFINDNLTLFDGTISFWVDGGSTSHNTSDYLGGYATRNLTGGTPPSVPSSLISGLGNAGSIDPPTQYMSVGQGFFIDATGTGNIVFDNSQRVFKTESSGDTNYYRNTESKNSNTENSYLRIGHEDPEGFHRQLLLGFLPKSTADLSYNLGYDALMNEVREDDLFFIIDNDLTQNYVIQGVGAFDEVYEFPLGLTVTEPGIHTIILDTVENFSNTVYVKDHVLNTTHDLSASSLILNLPPGEYLDRFSIVFQAANNLNINKIDKNQISAYYNTTTGNIIIDKPLSLIISGVTIYNLLGQKIIKVNERILKQQEIVIPFLGNDGLYLVNIKSTRGKETFKILKH